MSLISDNMPAEAMTPAFNFTPVISARPRRPITPIPREVVMHQDPCHRHAVFEVDLAREEARRRAEVVLALGPHWDPAAALRDEEDAHELLYSGLDAQQRETYDRLVSAGVLPRRETRRAAD
jgi:poly-gamma-glutamate capsule biosynthesis protein CapA/YwtB (metallophosphatase superfamily)